MSTFTECYLARSYPVIDIGITKCVFLLASHVIFLSRVSNSSSRTANKAPSACSVFTALVASVHGTWGTPKIPDTYDVNYKSCFQEMSDSAVAMWV